ncbi:N(6)-adenine-specific methyltransferase METTL4 [Rhagoletis pomonella]|uniref:N(6)-adenine-specific methyltransferase METTL4 n=1 Tax=Rhagoletis pomonella TaxID=28610 RepID=UPI00177DF160|nr:N(6)-adenine-specific methyltransferase METTL4 [Rhagoletis pomonella]
MHKIEIRNKIAIYLDHRELINKIYNNDIAELEEKYELHTELFHFHERRIEVEDSHTIQQPETKAGNSKLAEKSSKKRKRKLNKMAVVEELQKLKTIVEDILGLVKVQQLINRVESQNGSDLPRYWEEISTKDFPTFNGVNTTATYKRSRFGEHSYLIPPHCKFFNCDVMELSKLLPQLMPNSKRFDLIVLDPPWRNKYIRRLKRVREELGYQMLSSEQLLQMPIRQLKHERSIVAIWCTNSKELQRAIVEQLLPAWNLRLQHTIHWIKVNTSGQLIGPIDVSGQKKQPFEMLYLACHMDSSAEFCTSLQQVSAILSVPSVIHSHKPPLLPLLSGLLPQKPNCLEIFARYLQPRFVSVGLEVLKLMDERLYNYCDTSTGNAAIIGST